jgi:hypothetical protein
LKFVNDFQKNDSTNILNALKKRKLQEMKNGFDSLEILSMTLQCYFNEKIQEVLKDFNEKYFEIAVKNIKQNTNETISEKQVSSAVTLVVKIFGGSPLQGIDSYENFVINFFFSTCRFKTFLEISS